MVPFSSVKIYPIVDQIVNENILQVEMRIRRVTCLKLSGLNLN
jgi:hypothetical protein